MIFVKIFIKNFKVAIEISQIVLYNLVVLYKTQEHRREVIDFTARKGSHKG